VTGNSETWCKVEMVVNPEWQKSKKTHILSLFLKNYNMLYIPLDRYAIFDNIIVEN
jgi:hypothetical protein